MSSVWACVSVRRVLHGLPLHLVWPALCSLSGCAGATWGELGQRPGWGVVSPVSSDQNKKGTFFANTHPTFTKRRPSDCASLQKFQKIQKGPSRSLDCVIIS
nr:MAG TPA: hypothetical protein [Caudoviricetes sp.]